MSNPVGLEYSPAVSVSVTIEPASFIKFSDVTISATITSHASSPLTMFTWATIFNLALAQRRRNFRCIEVDTGTELFMELTKGPKRPGFSATLGGGDDKYFHTLEPGVPKTFRAHFSLASRVQDPCQTKAGQQCEVLEGRRYRFNIQEGEKIQSWWWGRKEEVMAPEGTISSTRKADGEPLVLEGMLPVEFEVREG